MYQEGKTEITPKQVQRPALDIHTKKFVVSSIRDLCDRYLKMLDEQQLAETHSATTDKSEKERE